MLRYFPYLFLLTLCLGCNGSSSTDEPQIAPVTENRYEFRDRIVWQQPGVVLDAMGDLEEMVVADIGAGEGFFAQRLAPLVDRVIAIEIDPVLVTYLRDTLRERTLPKKIQPRLEARLATANDPKLGEKEVDIILIVNTFLEIKRQADYLRKLFATLKDDGRIVIVDWKKRSMPIGPDPDKRIPLFRLEQMLQEAGYELVNSDDISLEYQYIVVAQKPSLTDE